MTLPVPFDRLPPAAIRGHSFGSGEPLFHQGDPVAGPGFVEVGAVELVRNTAGGARVVLHRAGAGESFAEASLFSDRYHCDCRAVVTPTRVLLLSKDAILAAASGDPAFSVALLQRLTHQVQDLRRLREINAIGSARERVHVALAEFGQQGTVAEFAGLVGLTPEATNRALSNLVQAGQARRLSRGRYAVI